MCEAKGCGQAVVRGVGNLASYFFPPGMQRLAIRARSGWVYSLARRSMKPLHYLALAALSLLSLNNSCHKDEGETPCPTQEIPGASPQYRPCVPGQSGSEAKLFVINSVAEYQAAFPCASTLPVATFADSTLLVGWKAYCCCGHVKSQRLLRACETNKYTYKVEIEEGPCAAAMPVISAWRVPKLPAGAQVAIDMQ